MSIKRMVKKRQNKKMTQKMYQKRKTSNRISQEVTKKRNPNQRHLQGIMMQPTKTKKVLSWVYLPSALLGNALIAFQKILPQLKSLKKSRSPRHAKTVDTPKRTGCA